MTLVEAISAIQLPCKKSMELSQKRWDSIAKPLKSLGKLETTVIKIAGMIRSPQVDLKNRCVVIMCADNGVVAQGVTQTDSSVTAIVTENFTKGDTSVCVMAACAGADVIPVDIGVARDIKAEGLINLKIMYGTHDMTFGSAMSRKEAIAAIEAGINLAIRLKESGYHLIATGEMGIGNTTTSSAIASVLLHQEVEEVTGRGAGLDNEGLKRKLAAIRKAIALNAPDPDDAIDVLAKVGGLDIAGIAGLFIGGAVAGLPVVIDGFISAVSALVASRIAPACMAYMLPSHVSAEPAGRMMLDALGLEPLIICDMCLGEGTGAVAVLGILDMAVEVYTRMATFADINVEQYVDFEEQAFEKRPVCLC